MPSKKSQHAAGAAFDASTLSSFDAEIGARLRACRKVAGLSQTELGEKVGVSFQQIQKYERGANRLSCSALIAFAAILNISPSSLLDDVHAAAAAADGGVPRDRVRDMTHSPAGARIAAAFGNVDAEGRILLAGLAERFARIEGGVDACAA